MAKMLIEKTWEDFQKTGLLWMVNTFLHVFGWALVIHCDNKGKVLKCLPARTKYRGFPERTSTDGYKKVTKWVYKNSKQLLKDIKET